MLTTNHIAPRGQVHAISPAKSTIRLIHAIRNFSSVPGVCHIGLGVTAANNIKVLRSQGIHAEAWSTQTFDDLAKKLQGDPGFPAPVSHVVVSSPAWVTPAQFRTLTINHPNIEFVVLNHSGAAYLSIDKFGIKNIRGDIDLEAEAHNFRVAANNSRVNDWLRKTFGFKGLLLTNLYDTSSFVKPYPARRAHGSTMRIGSFGASRPWKNQLCAAEGAVQLARQLGANLELYVNSKRPDGGERMIESRAELFSGLRGCKIIEVPWEPWPRFRSTCAHMHLLLQPSFDETFNVVTADGIAAGVASVTSSAIEWTPRTWWCETENPGSIAAVAIRLLNDEFAVEEGREALISYVHTGIGLWTRYLMGEG
jgi:hypothetical protein